MSMLNIAYINNMICYYRFMETHGIGASIVSLANPWFDFLEGAQAVSVAQELNDELQAICESAPGKLHGFASLPVRNIPGLKW